MRNYQLSWVFILIAMNVQPHCGLVLVKLNSDWSYLSSTGRRRSIMTLGMSDMNDAEYSSDKTPTKRWVVYRRNSNSRGRRARILRSVQETQPIVSPKSAVLLPLSSDESYLSLPMDDDMSTLVQAVVRAVDMRKAENIVVLKVSQITSLTEFIIICSGNSRPQNQAIAGAVQQEVRETFAGTFKVRGNGAPEGSADSGWIILDYGDIMVHVMTPRSRLYFDIEGKWKGKGAKIVDISNFIITSNSPISSFVNTKAPRDSNNPIYPSVQEDAISNSDPFWS